MYAILMSNRYLFYEANEKIQGWSSYMVIRIFFSVSFLLLLFGMIFVYKVPEKVSLFRSMVLCYITELCFGAAAVGIYMLIGVPIGLVSLGIVYFIMGAIVWAIILGRKKFQKVKILRMDIYSAFIIMLWFLFLFLYLFSPSITNIYTNSDPAVHFQNALRVLDSGKASAMYFAEVYNAVIMELLEPFLVRITLYKAFIIADSFANLINVFMFYCLTATFIKSRLTRMIVPFISFLYFAGWPFFSYVIGGFVYFGWGVTLFAYVVYLLIKLYDSEDRRNQLILLGLVLLGSFCVLVSYLLFVVSLACVVFISLICIAKKKGFDVSKKSVFKVGIAILLLALGIFAFCFWGFFRGDLTYALNALKRDGWTAKEVYRDFVFLLPGIFYMGWRYIKNREVNITGIAVGVILAFIFSTFILYLCGIISAYYYYKSYYLLWFFAWIINAAFIEYLFEKDKVMLFSYGGALFFAIFMTMSGVDSKLAEKGIAVDEISLRWHWYPSLFPIWDYMELFTRQQSYFVDNNALVDVSQYVNEAIPETEEVPMIMVSGLYWIDKWYYTYTGNPCIYLYEGDEYMDAIQNCIDSGYNYLVLYQNAQRYRDNKELIREYEIVYDNGYYGVYMIR